MESILSLLRSMRGVMGPASARIADYIQRHPQSVLSMSLTEIAEETEASESLVI